MPALTMRGRYLMREYWEDSDLFLRLTAEERELYVGLWMLADDAGWLPRDVPAIAASLYRYMDRTPREAHVTTILGRLRELGKVVSHRCCLHVPSVERWPRSGRKTFEHRDEHIQRHSNRSKGGSNPSPVPSSPVPSQPPARAPEGAAPRDGNSEFDRSMAANGYPRPKAVS